MLLTQVMRGAGRSLIMTCNEEPLSDIQLQELARRRADLERFQAGLRPFAEAANVIGTAEEAGTDANGLLLSSSLSLLGHAGAVAVYETLAQRDWRLEGLLADDSAPAVICQQSAAARGSPVKGVASADEQLADMAGGRLRADDSDLAESVFQRRDQSAIHLTGCVQRPKYNSLLIQGRATALSTVLPPNVRVGTAAELRQLVGAEAEAAAAAATAAAAAASAAASAAAASSAGASASSSGHLRQSHEDRFDLAGGSGQHQADEDEGLPLLEEGIEIVTFGDDPNQLYVHDSQNPCDQEGNTVLVALDVYYFGRQECQLPAQPPEPRQDLRFRCHLCSKILYSNLSTVRHILSHFDPASQLASALLQDCAAEIVRCQACAATFAGHYQLAEHRSEVHLTPAGRKLCRVCDREFLNTEQFARHMRTRHRRRQMPYACQLCSFRTSLLKDILAHFCRAHASSPHLLCPLCLKAFRITFPSGAAGAYAPGTIGGDSSGLTGVFTQHLQRHFDEVPAAALPSKRCYQCSLTFINKTDLNMHQQLDHKPGDLQQLEDLQMANTGAPAAQPPQAEKSPQVAAATAKSLNAAPAETARDLSSVALPVHLDDSTLCLECRGPLNGPDHRHYVPCTAGQCRYATCCGVAYARHAALHDAGVAMDTEDTEADIEEADGSNTEEGCGDFYCAACGFSTDSGDRMAGHLEAGTCGSRCALLLPDLPAEK